MTSTIGARQNLLQYAAAIWSDCFGAQTGALSVIVSDGNGREVAVSFPLEAEPAPLPPAKLSPVEADICRVLSSGPLPGKAIAARLGGSLSGYLKQTLANLAARGVLFKTELGYNVATERINEP